MTRRQRPFPHLGDTALQRARGIAVAYRTHLHTANPTVCDALDDAARAAGEGWVIPRTVTVNLDDLIGTAAAAELAGVEQGTIRQWRKRGYVDRHGHSRKLEPKTRDHRGWPLFLAAEILEVAAATRRRRQRQPG